MLRQSFQADPHSCTQGTRPACRASPFWRSCRAECSCQTACGDVGQRFAVKAQLAVGIILNQDDIFIPNDIIHGFAVLGGVGKAGGILEVRHGIDEFHPRRRKRGGKALNIQTVLAECDGMERGRILQEGLERAEVAGLFHNDAVARVQGDFGDEVKRLLGAGRDENIGGGHAKAVFFIAARRDEFAQLRDAGRERILEQLCTIAFHGMRHGFAERFHREGERAGQAARKGDDFRILCGLQHALDEGGRESLDVFTKQLLGSGFHSGCPFCKLKNISRHACGMALTKLIIINNILFLYHSDIAAKRQGENQMKRIERSPPKRAAAGLLAIIGHGR